MTVGRSGETSDFSEVGADAPISFEDGLTRVDGLEALNDLSESMELVLRGMPGPSAHTHGETYNQRLVNALHLLQRAIRDNLRVETGEELPHLR